MWKINSIIQTEYGRKIIGNFERGKQEKVKSKNIKKQEKKNCVLT